ncbi:MAG: hypothetical protein ISS36_00130 [Candidatus Aenigmarchaeota archaeon]|nr:hypothetical protein [Candidatus Aenigmarchaeota archaeon]
MSDIKIFMRFVQSEKEGRPFFYLQSRTNDTPYQETMRGYDAILGEYEDDSLETSQRINNARTMLSRGKLVPQDLDKYMSGDDSVLK